MLILKVHLTPKYFFLLKKYLYLFETHCAFLPCFNPSLDLFLAVKVTKSGHHLSHDWASMAYGSLHVVYKELIRCKSVCDIKPGIDPGHLLARLCDRWQLLQPIKKSRCSLKRHSAFQAVRKKYFGVSCTLIMPCFHWTQLQHEKSARFWYSYLLWQEKYSMQFRTKTNVRFHDSPGLHNSMCDVQS